jgi:hypothetical protein
MYSKIYCKFLYYFLNLQKLHKVRARVTELKTVGAAESYQCWEV